jgi:hypothetical protein
MKQQETFCNYRESNGDCWVAYPAAQSLNQLH